MKNFNLVNIISYRLAIIKGAKHQCINMQNGSHKTEFHITKYFEEKFSSKVLQNNALGIRILMMIS